MAAGSMGALACTEECAGDTTAQSVLLAGVPDPGRPGGRDLWAPRGADAAGAGGGGADAAGARGQGPRGPPATCHSAVASRALPP